MGREVRVIFQADGLPLPTRPPHHGKCVPHLLAGCAIPIRGPQPDVAPLELLPRLADIEWMRSNAGNVLPLTLTQYKIMQAWARGDFFNDLGEPADERELLADALTRVALEACVGAALYPGIEVNGYIMNFPERFLEGEPFRI